MSIISPNYTIKKYSLNSDFQIIGKEYVFLVDKIVISNIFTLSDDQKEMKLIDDGYSDDAIEYLLTNQYNRYSFWTYLKDAPISHPSHYSELLHLMTSSKTINTDHIRNKCMDYYIEKVKDNPLIPLPIACKYSLIELKQKAIEKILDSSSEEKNSWIDEYTNKQPLTFNWYSYFSEYCKDIELVKLWCNVIPKKFDDMYMECKAEYESLEMKYTELKEKMERAEKVEKVEKKSNKKAEKIEKIENKKKIQLRNEIVESEDDE